MDLVEGILIADRYRLIRPLGQGGMGAVWFAHHIGLEIPCALKFVDESVKNQPEMRVRFEREAKVEAQLRSPHVVRILDHGVWNDTPYIAMEFLDGESLSVRLDRVGKLDLPTTQRVVAHVARALSRAHGLGIVHRDLKPENIFIVPEEDGEVTKVLDFGVAKWEGFQLGTTATKTGSLLGTPLYMSPEQARGNRAVDHRSDLWSLAVIAYQCLTGRLPFVSDGLGDLLAQIMFAPLPVPSEVCPELPRGFDAWWLRGASRALETRFQTAKELSDELAAALGIAQPTSVASSPPPRLPFASDPGEDALMSWARLSMSRSPSSRPSPSTTSVSVPSISRSLGPDTPASPLPVSSTWGPAARRTTLRRSVVGAGVALAFGLLIALTLAHNAPPPPHATGVVQSAVEAGAAQAIAAASSSAHGAGTAHVAGADETANDPPQIALATATVPASTAAVDAGHAAVRPRAAPPPPRSPANNSRTAAPQSPPADPRAKASGEIDFGI